MQKERILIAVKTYPTLSRKYSELVCTAGFKEDGSWIRLYPLPFRSFNESQQYKKYQWIELEIAKNKKDRRPESYCPINIDDINLGDVISTHNNWEERRRLILSKNIIHTNLQTICDGAKSNKYSLVIFKPKKIHDLVEEKVDNEWKSSRKQISEASLSQGSLFDENVSREYKLAEKLPYKFSYRFTDEEDKESTLMIEDWEIGQLYWNCLKSEETERDAIAKVKEKYLSDLAQSKDIHLFLGTTLEWHGRAPNPYVIIGTFHPPYDRQDKLF